MKKLMLGALLLLSMVSTVYSQDYSLKDGYFNTVIQSGIGVKVNVKFAISQQTIDTLLKHPCFLYWDSVTYNDPANKEFVLKHKAHTHLETYLSSNVAMASIWAQSDIKVRDSYAPIETAEGRIRLDEMGYISIVHPFQAQNGYGNMVFCKAFYLSKWVNGKTQTTHFVR
jgi:hypothetical protein